MTKIKWNKGALYELRSAPGVVADLERRAKAVEAAAGPDYMMGSQQGAKKPQGRWRTSVVTMGRAGKRDNAKNNTLIKALDAGR